MRYLVVFLALAFGGWLLFDGSRAFITGNYTVPHSGPYAGMLGPWSQLVRAVGLDPLGNTVKIIHVLLGVSWVGSALFFLGGRPGGRGSLMLSALFTLWYLPFGTLVGASVAALLLLSSMR
jgi:hypothetical protein